MKFLGIIEASPFIPYMLNLPILGVGTEDEFMYIGPITGNLEDLKIGHATTYNSDVDKFIAELHESMCPGIAPYRYLYIFSTYKEACSQFHLYLEGRESLAVRYGDDDILLDITFIKNKLAKVITET